MRLLKSNLLLLLIALGTISWSLTMVKSGWLFSYGIGFWGPNGHDGIWHLALINHLLAANNLNFLDMPVFSGEAFKNYHLGFDLFVAFLHQMTGISTLNLYFQILPPIFALLIGWLSYKLVLDFTNSKVQALWSLFFVYFSGSFGWLVTLFRDGQIGGESMFWAQSAVSTLLNPPFAASLIVLLAGIIALVRYEKTKNWKYLLVVVLFFGLVIEIKVYAGILALGGLVFLGVLRVIRDKNFTYLIASVASGAISFIAFKLFTRTEGNLLVYQPFWFLETMMALSDRFGWQRYFDAMMAYKSGGNFVKAIPAYTIAFVIFWFGNLGTRGIKEILVFRWIRDWRGLGVVETFSASVIVGGVLIPMFFLQKGTPWNTIQFTYYSLFFSSILAGIVAGQWLEKNKNRVVWGTILVLLTIPTSFSTLWYHYLPARPPAKISTAELDALKFLKSQPKGVVLTYPFDRTAAEKAIANPPRPLYLYESTAYVAAFSAQPIYLEDEVNMDITDYNWKDRRKKVLDWLGNLNQDEVRGFLEENDIRYIYWVKPQRAILGETQIGVLRIFENSEVDIYKINKSGLLAK